MCFRLFYLSLPQILLFNLFLMKKFLVLTLKIVGVLVALLVVLLVAAALYVNSSAGQQRLLGFATNLLQDKLETKVQIDCISIDFSRLDVNLLGLEVEDRQQRPLLQTDRIAVKLDWKKLMARRVEVESADINGLRAELHQPKDSAANFQFIIDAFKTDNPKTEKPKTKSKLAFDIHRLRLTDIYLEHHHVTKKRGYQMTDTYRLKELTLKQKRGKQLVLVDSLHYITDNHHPRKNAGKPKRGYFDAGHLDVTASMEFIVNHYGKDTVNVSLSKCTASDSITGFHFSDIHLEVGVGKQVAYLRNVYVKHRNTTLAFDSATIHLPSKKLGRQLAYRTSLITGTTQLKDISRLFAPVLRQFSIPVAFKVELSGTDSTMHFRKVHVNTTDQKLKVDATGDISHLQEKEKLFIRFNVSRMNTDAMTAKKIINQFVVKKFMMRQLNNLGAISYKGSFDVLYKMEKFRGVVNTSKGYLAFNLTLNEQTKYLTGSARTKGFRLGQVIEMKDIDDVGFKADFSFDYSKPRTAKVRRLRGGKLPIGWVSVNSVETRYKKIKFNDISATIKSDGVEAVGHIIQRKKLTDVLCHFTFNNTDSINKMKIKPGMRINLPWQKKTDEEKRAALKAKENKKAEKAARKAEKKAAREQRKIEKKAAKEARKN